MTVPSEETIDFWLSEMGLSTLEKKGPGNWQFFNRYNEHAFRVNILVVHYNDGSSSKLHVGSYFLDRPKDELLPALHQKLLELQRQTWEAKFFLTQDLNVLLVVERNMEDLSKEQFGDALATVVALYQKFKEECVQLARGLSPAPKITSEEGEPEQS